MNRWSAVAIALCALLSLAPGRLAAGSQAEKAQVDSQEKVTIPMLMIVDGNTPDEKNVVKAAIEKKFNVELKLEKNSSDEAHLSKLRLMLAADQLPDLIETFPAVEAKPAGQKGMLVALNKYWKDMPSYYKWMHADKNTVANVAAMDGNVYVAPRYDLYQRVHRVPWMRVDILKSMNLPVPETFDQLKATLKAVKAAQPDNLGMVSGNGYRDMPVWGFYFNTTTGFEGESPMMYDRYQDRFVFGPFNPGYQEMVSFFNGLWKEKLMDPDFFTTSSKMFNDKSVKGNMLVVINTDDSAWKQDLKHRAAYPTSKLDYEIVIPFKSNSLPERAVSVRQKVNTYWSWAVSAKARNLPRILKIIDWMYSEEGSVLANCGVEGTHFNWVEQNGRKVWKYVPTLNREYNPQGKLDPRAEFHLRHPHTARLVRDYWDEFVADNDFIAAHNATLAKMAAMKGYMRNNDDIELSFTQAQYDRIAEIATTLQTYIDENTVKFITGERPLDQYRAFAAQCEKLGAKELEQIYADAYATWKKLLGR